MRAVVQRVKSSKVTVNGKITGEIGKGINVLLGIESNDTEKDIKYIADKIMKLRIFEDENDKMNLSALDIGGEILSISQFTLYGDCRKGRRPSFIHAAKPELGESLYDVFNGFLRQNGLKVETGKFGGMMDVDIYNHGPVTIILDTQDMLAKKS